MQAIKCASFCAGNALHVIDTSVMSQVLLLATVLSERYKLSYATRRQEAHAFQTCLLISYTTNAFPVRMSARYHVMSVD